MMNKLTIPTILMATVMVAGMFAFMPVEQASTVHTTIQGSQTQVQSAEDLTNQTAASNNDVLRITVSTNNNTPFVIESMITCFTSGGDQDVGGGLIGNNEAGITSITIDGDLLETSAGAALTIGVLVIDGTTGTACNDALEALSNANAADFGGIVVSNGADVVVDFELQGTGDDLLTQVKVTALIDGSSTLAVASSLP